MGTSSQSGPLAAGAGSLRQVMRRHPLFFFFLLTYAFSWIFLMVEVLQAWGFLPNYRGFAILVNILFTFGPAVAAIIMTGIVEGKAGTLRLRQRIRQGRAGWRWYLFILAGIPALLMLGIVIQPGALAGFTGFSPVRLLVTYLINFVIIWFGGGPLGEEIGWRGFALPRMQPRYGPLWGTLLLGILWCFWHLPQFLTPIQGGGPGTGLANFLTNFSLFFFLALALAIIFTWLFNHTQGSIFIAITAHASVDTPEAVLLPLFPAVAYGGLLLAAAIGCGAAALLILILTRGRLGYQARPVQSFGPGDSEAQRSE